MKALLICVGSRGDAEPYCALAAELVKKNHQVEFFIQPELKDLAPQDENVNVHLLPFTQFDFYKYAGNPTKGLDNPNPRVKFVGIVTDCIAALVFPCASDVLNVASNGCDVIVASALARSLAFAVAEKVDIPTCLVHLQPLVPTNLFPHYSHTDDFLAAIIKTENDTTATTIGTSPDPKHLESYWYLEEVQHNFLQPDLDKVYESMDLTPIDFEKTKTILSGNHPKVWLANCFYDDLIPNIVEDDDTRKILNIGALADAYLPKDFSPPDDDLCQFLKDKRPICIGFGSMPFGQVKDILQVLKELDQSAVLVGKALELPQDDDSDDWNKDHIRQVSSLPYAWLLPQCSMMLSHGGAGVLHATLRAGIPPVIAPLMGDQFVHAELVKALGLGVRVGAMLPTITKDEWKSAITAALEESRVASAKAFGTKIQSQTTLGVERMAQALEEKIVVQA